MSGLPPLTGSAALAQTGAGVLTGTIRDSQGGVLPGVTVVVVHDNATGVHEPETVTSTRRRRLRHHRPPDGCSLSSHRHVVGLPRRRGNGHV